MLKIQDPYLGAISKDPYSGKFRYFLGIEVASPKQGIFLVKRRSIKGLLEETCYLGSGLKDVQVENKLGDDSWTIGLVYYKKESLKIKLKYKG